MKLNKKIKDFEQLLKDKEEKAKIEEQQFLEFGPEEEEDDGYEDV